MTETLVNKAGILRFIDILLVFIKQDQAKAKKVKNIKDKQYKEDDLS